MYYEEKYGTVKLKNVDYSAYIDKYHYFNKWQLKKAFTRLKKTIQTLHKKDSYDDISNFRHITRQYVNK